MVLLRIGKDLDRGTCAPPSSALGELTTGPHGLLNWLESQLGLSLPPVSFTARLVPYLTCLRDWDFEHAFYRKSLARDEFGVATRLLQWRDAWFEAGWDGDGFDVDASSRLLELGTVEKSAGAWVPPGPGQRVQRVLEALESTQLDVAVELLDPPEVFPKVWQLLFERLGASVKVHVLEPQCDGDTDLARLQRALVTERDPGEKLKLTGDGTVIVLRDGSPQLSAPWVARFAHRHLVTNGDVAILAGDHGATLDDALADAGFPRLGFSDASFWRPAFQVLPLALELMWEPLDPGILLQFLTHPMGPIPRHIREPLADVVARQPGIGGEGWNKAVDKALTNAVEDLDEDAAKAKRADELEKIKFWLMGERVDPRAGASIELLIQRVRRVSDWLGAAANVQEDDARAAVYRAALGQSDDLLRTLDRLGQSGTNRLTRESLRRLVEAVRGTGTDRPGRPRQCAAGEAQVLRADTPAAFLSPVDNVIWWGCDDERMPGAYPWSASEIAALENFGVELVPLNTQLEWQAKSWLRPLLAARKRLVLVLHDNAETHHPIFDQLLAIAEGWTEERVDRLMRDPSLLPLGDELPATRPIAAQTIPGKQRWWQLPDGVALPNRKSESFSSLEKFLYGPHQWVLNYQARIKPGALAELAEGSTLKGLLTHDLFEQFFNHHPDIAAIDHDVARVWARSQMRLLIAQRGAVLLTPGRQSEREYFIEMAVRALGALIEHLQSANVISVDMEKYFDGRFGGGAMNGFIDLVATKADGQHAVVDIKWGGLAYRRDSLQESKYLQLGVYAQLARQALGRYPVFGYFIIRDARLLMLDSDFFPSASKIQPDNGESHLEFWQRVEATWKWRRQQIESGMVEVPVTGTEPDEDSAPGELGLEMPKTFDRFDDYSVLTGWKDDS